MTRLVKTNWFTFLSFVAIAVLCTNAIPTEFFDQVHNDLHEQEQQKWNGTIWALLVAGSNEWYNYRHQADVCHSYQVLHEHGIPDENIVVMMYDDIAYNEENPTPGIVINHPGGKNVYTNVPKDYVNNSVNPDIFLRVLRGDQGLAAEGHKVIASGPDDHVFVYFADHGAPGLIAFPDDELKASQLMKTLKSMAKNRQFSKMVLYIEACESGSMFENLLPRNLNIYATTAANSTESSYAVYYDDQRDTYLGDVYSVNWLEDSDRRGSLAHETIEKQFRLVRTETNTSHCKEFGDLSIAQLPLSQFQGLKATTKDVTNCLPAPVMYDAVPSPEVPFMIAAKKLAKARNDNERTILREKYNLLVDGRRFLHHQMERIAGELQKEISVGFEDLWSTKRPITKHDCYENFVETFDQHCFDLSDHPYALRYLYVFVNFCENIDHDLNDSEDFINRIRGKVLTHCNQHVKEHSFTGIL